MYQRPEQCSATFSTDRKVGGVFGFEQTRSATNFIVQTQFVQPGGELPVKIECDNSQCKSAVKSFKFKLFRTVSFMIDNNPKQSHEILYQVKLPGADKKTSVVREHTIEIPRLEHGLKV